MNLIILAAGRNSRLDQGMPKCLIELNGETLLERHLRIFNKVGVREVCIVTGFRASMIEEAIRTAVIPKELKVNLIHNDRFDLENGYSLYVAKDWLKDAIDPAAFYLTMSDHVFSEGFVEQFVRETAQSTQEIILAVDKPGKHNRHIDIDDVTKVKANDHMEIVEIGKTIKNFDFYDTGLFRMTSDVINTMNNCFERGEFSLSHVVKENSRKSTARVLIMSDYHTWSDVDNEQDLLNARGLWQKSKL